MLKAILDSNILQMGIMQRRLTRMKTCSHFRNQIWRKNIRCSFYSTSKENIYENSLILSVQEAVNLSPLNENVCINGWVKSLRKMGKKTTFIDIVDGLSPYRIQVVADTKLVPDNMCYHSAVSVVGNIVKSNYKGQEVELIAKDVHLVNSTQISDSNDSSFVEKCHKRDTEDEEESQNDSEKDMSNEIYPFAPRKRYPDDYCRMYPQFRSKLADFGCVLRMRSAVTHAIQDFFHKRYVDLTSVYEIGKTWKLSLAPDTYMI